MHTAVRGRGMSGYSQRKDLQMDKNQGQDTDGKGG